MCMYIHKCIQTWFMLAITSTTHWGCVYCRSVYTYRMGQKFGKNVENQSGENIKY